MSPNPGQGNYYRPSKFGGFQFFPPVIKSLLIINAAAFIVLSYLGSMKWDGYPLAEFLTRYFALLPYDYGFLPWQLVTYQFMHADFWHLFYNMLGLWMFGMEVEHVWGSKRLLLFYLTCGIVAGLTQLVLSPILEPGSVITSYGQVIPTVGASGAVYGVLVAFAMMFPDRYIFLYFLVPVKAKYLISGMIILGIMSVGNHTAIANLAHLGGAAAGYAYVLILARRYPFQRFIEQIGWLINKERYKRRETQHEDVVEAKVYDIGEQRPRTEQELNQLKIDAILDKISQGGYQSLTEEEKRILFEASKKLN